VLRLTPELIISDVELCCADQKPNVTGCPLTGVLHPDYVSIVNDIKSLKNEEKLNNSAIFGRFGEHYIYALYTAEATEQGYNVRLYEPVGLGPDETRKNNSAIGEIAERLLGTFYRSDRFGNFIFFTDNSAKLLGYTPEELLGGSLRSQFAANERSYDLLKQKIMRDGHLEDAEIALRHKDGRIIWLKIDLTAFYDENGNYAGGGGYVQDITHYKNKEDELSHSRRLLDIKQAELDALKMNMKFQVQTEVSKGRKQQEDILYHARLAEMGEMVSSIAHQWRQPLSALSFIIEDIRDAYHFGELDIQYLDDAIDECMSYIRFMSETMDDFRNFFRPEPDKEYFNLIEKTVDVVKMQYGRFEVGAVNVTIMCDIDGQQGHVLTLEYGHGVRFHSEDFKTDAGIVVFGYPNLYKQVIINLLNNSVDAIMESREDGSKGVTEAGHIYITTGVKEGTAFISIEDNGTGIPADIMCKIFDSEFTTKPKSKGTGIGLHMAKAIVENSLNGSITCDNGKHGARFTVEMPHIPFKAGN
jgi:PAS domain S-box-containing protein